MKKKITAMVLLLVMVCTCASCKKNKTENKETEYVYFGAYPQTEVTDASMQSELTALAGDTESWNSYNYYLEGKTSDFMKYKDVTYNEEMYRGVYFTSYRPFHVGEVASNENSYQDENDYNPDTIYWFKYEPIKWRVLSDNDGDKLLFAEMLLDAQDFDGDETPSNNYENSRIREWLNDTFYETAFSSDEQSKIKTSKETNDKIFLLSYEEATNEDYGFTNFDSRTKKTTDYAKAQGAITVFEEGYWWLRTPYEGMDESVCDVTHNGDFEEYKGVKFTNVSVAPALHVTL